MKWNDLQKKLDIVSAKLKMLHNKANRQKYLSLQEREEYNHLLNEASTLKDQEELKQERLSQK